MKKITCPRKGCKHPAVIHKQFGILPCISCQEKDSIPLNIKPRFYDRHHQNRVQEQWDHNEKDLIQPFMGNKPNKEFAKAYPDKIKDYFSSEQIKEMDI